MEQERSMDTPVEQPRIVIVIPTYNNEKTVRGVIEDVKKYVPDIIVVNDGSTDTTAAILASIEGVLVETFPENRGKGCALHAGFQKATALGFTHAITIDSDGQHLAEDLPLFIQKIQAEPETLWIGNRVIPYDKGVEPPKRSTFGRNFGNFWYKFFTNIVLHDTQCGFRAYPLKSALAVNSRKKRYDYEQELLIRTAWNGTPVKEIAMHLYYQSKEDKVVHFRPVRDFLRISKVNAKYGFIRVVNPFVVLDVPGNTWKEKIVHLVKYELKAHATPPKAAASLALGVFLGIFPIHGLQVVTLMGLAVLLRLNKPLAFLGVCISSPPCMPFLIIAAVAIGRLVVPVNFFSLHGQKTAELIAQGALEFIVGSVILAFASGAVTYVVSYPLFRQLAKTRFFRR